MEELAAKEEEEENKKPKEKEQQSSKERKDKGKGEEEVRVINTASPRHCTRILLLTICLELVIFSSLFTGKGTWTNTAAICVSV